MQFDFLNVVLVSRQLSMGISRTCSFPTDRSNADLVAFSKRNQNANECRNKHHALRNSYALVVYFDRKIYRLNLTFQR